MIDEEDFRALFDVAADAMFILDQDRLIREVNQIAYKQLGYTKSEMLGKHIGDFILPEFAAVLDYRISRVQKDGFLVYESAQVRKDGSVLPVEICSRAVALDKQQAIFSIVRDISERKLAERMLRAREERFQIMFDRASEGIVILAPNGKFVAANESFARMHGYTTREIQAINLKDLDTPEGARMIPERMQRILSGESLTFEVENYHKDGHIISMEVSSSLIVVDGEPLIQSFARDITKRKRTEAALRESEEKFQAVMNASEVAVAWATEQGKIEYVNPKFISMFGYTLHDVPTVEQWYLHAYPDPAYRAKVVTEWNSKIAHSISARTPIGTMEVDVACKDGTVRNILLISSWAGTRLLVNFSDITERKLAEKALRESEEKLRGLYELSPLGIALTDINGSYVEFNQAFLNICGYTGEELKLLDYWKLTPRKYEADEVRQLESLNSTGRYGPYEKEYVRKDGSLIPLRLNGVLIAGSDGQKYIWSIVEDITERKRSEDEIKHLAFYDPLTHLPNRRLLQDRLKQALISSLRTGRSGALLFIDLDNFKNLNDTLGHDIGDMLLKQVTQRLEACLREGDTVARLGGDEFVVMLVDLSEQTMEAAAQTEAIGEKILAALNQPYQLGSYVHRCTASIGVTLFAGTQQAMDELMKQADIAMYQAKKAGRNTLRFFDRQMQENISSRVSLESELHHALEFQQFHLHYQIQMDGSHRPLGAEALIRWLHPERGTISPVQFIPLAEETGLILPIGLWVLETACAQIRAWGQDARTRELTLAVNVSARQFRQADFVAQVQAAVQRHAINPRLLKLELTESLLQENIEETIAIMNALSDTGVQFSLDDFGTGYSSLQYLKRLPLDQLKIDQSFVRDLASNSSDIAVVRATIAMARSLELDVIAEGVETEEQRQLLLDNGCTHYQGYLFGRPVPVQQFEALVKHG